MNTCSPKKIININTSLKQYIAQYPDFPKKGILFKDLNPIYSDPKAFNILIDYMHDKAVQLGSFDYILGIEARGFILGVALAQKLNAGFVPIRKKNKLPGKVYSAEYALEYGTDCLQIQADEKLNNKRILVIDDVFATGGTIKAVLNMLDKIASYIALGIALDIGLSDIKNLNKDYFVVFDNDE